MSAKLELQKQILDGKVSVIVKGVIDEDADFSGLFDLKSLSYIFDFAGLTMLNSCGIREWIRFIEQIGSGVAIVYRNCPQIMVEQMGMVYGFIRKDVTVESFHAPYFCSDCDQEKKILLRGDQVPDLKAPALKCDKCGVELEFDEIEEQYFAFLRK